MSSVKFMQSISRVSKVPRIKNNPFVEGEFVCPVSRKKQQIRISTIRKCLENGEPDAVAKFIEKVPQYLPYVVAAMIDSDELVAFNAEWCVRMLACTPNDLTRILLRHCLSGFLNSSWVIDGKNSNNLRAVELSNEIREVYDFISN